MRILAYLKSFGEKTLQAKTNLVALATGFDRIISDARVTIEENTKHLYLKSATESFLDRWGKDLLGIRRKPLEEDEAFRSRIIQNLFLANGTRSAIRESIKMLMGQYPTEIYEPVRDSAFFDARYYMVQERKPDGTAASDGTGRYCSRFGDQRSTPHVGYVKVPQPGNYVAGGGLAFYSAESFFDTTDAIYGEIGRASCRERV